MRVAFLSVELSEVTWIVMVLLHGKGCQAGGCNGRTAESWWSLSQAGRYEICNTKPAVRELCRIVHASLCSWLMKQQSSTLMQIHQQSPISLWFLPLLSSKPSHELQLLPCFPSSFSLLEGALHWLLPWLVLFWAWACRKVLSPLTPVENT